MYTSTSTVPAEVLGRTGRRLRLPRLTKRAAADDAWGVAVVVVAVHVRRQDGCSTAVAATTVEIAAVSSTAPAAVTMAANALASHGAFNAVGTTLVCSVI